MTKSYLFLMLITLGFLISCSKETENIDNLGNELIKSLTVQVDGVKIEAELNHSEKLIILSGITDGNDIESVTYELEDGCTIYPKPESLIGSWEEKEVVELILGSKVVRYTIILKDYVNNKVLVNSSLTQQTIEFVGGDMERSQKFMQKCSDPQLVADWCFKDVNFDICRVSYDKQQEMIEGTKNWDFYADAVKSMKNVLTSNPDIKFWATMKSDYNGYDDENNLPDWICDYNPTTYFNTDQYAEFLADYLEHMYDEGVPISYLSTSKEWVGVITAARTKLIIEKLKSECEGRDIPMPLIIDPASWGITQGVNFIKDAKAEDIIDYFYAFSTHNYNSAESADFVYEKFVEEASKYNKLSFADETGTGHGGRTNGTEPENLESLIDAYCEKCEIYRDGFSGEIFFEVFSRGVNSETRNVYFTNGSVPKRMKSYYVMKNFANGIAGKPQYIEPEFISIDGDIDGMSVKHDDNIFIMLINKGSNNNNGLTVEVSNIESSLTASSVYFDIKTPVDGVTTSTLPVNNNSVNIDLPAQSIMFITFNIVK